MVSTAHEATIEGFGLEWSTYDQAALSPGELTLRFNEYFSIFPLDGLRNAEGFDLGCGSGRWDRLLAPKVGKLNCIDPSPVALSVARRALCDRRNVSFHLADADSIPLRDGSQDFGIALGVLHHTKDPGQALRQAAKKLRPGAPFLIYLYYDFENRGIAFRVLWRGTDIARRLICRLPFKVKRAVSDAIAALVYLPLARLALLLEKIGSDVSGLPLSSYRRWSFYSMRTDALDRFGTRIEHRFSRADIRKMMDAAGLADVHFSEGPPYWVALGEKIDAAMPDPAFHVPGEPDFAEAQLKVPAAVVAHVQTG